MTPNPAARAATSPVQPPAAAGPRGAGAPSPVRGEPADYTGWYVSSLELRQGLSVVDLDDPDLHRLFR